MIFHQRMPSGREVTPTEALARDIIGGRPVTEEEFDSLEMHTDQTHPSVGDESLYPGESEEIYKEWPRINFREMAGDFAQVTIIDDTVWNEIRIAYNTGKIDEVEKVLNHYGEDGKRIEELIKNIIDQKENKYSLPKAQQE